MTDSFPWLWLYGEALRYGMDADTFWKSSPRAVYLFIRHVRRPIGKGTGAKPAAGMRNRSNGAPPARRVRLNYLPHP